VSDIDWDALERAAIAARSRAYCPYSKYRVGAALLGADGRVWAGCNVENASYGLTNCAERTAVFSMVAGGDRSLRAVVVVTAGPEAGSPCGACRQVLGEFCDDAPVRMLAVDENDAIVDRRETTVSALLPGRFRGELVTGVAKS
jgi:cytidine deaminase